MSQQNQPERGYLDRMEQAVSVLQDWLTWEGGRCQECKRVHEWTPDLKPWHPAVWHPKYEQVRARRNRLVQMLEDDSAEDQAYWRAAQRASLAGEDARWS